MQAVIMAGGRGSRLMPLTTNRPKPLVPILDKPLLHYILQAIQKAGITEVAVTLGYLGEQIEKEIHGGEEYGLKIKYFYEKEPLGTAGGVKNASKFLNEDFVIISGDAYTDINLSELIAFHREKKGLVTLAAGRVPNPSDFGVIMSNYDGFITGFEEKPKFPKSNLVNTGIYVASKVITQLIPNGFCDFAKDIFPCLRGRLYAYTGNFFWSDVGTLESYYNANLHAVKVFRSICAGDTGSGNNKQFLYV